MSIWTTDTENDWSPVPTRRFAEYTCNRPREMDSIPLSCRSLNRWLMSRCHGQIPLTTKVDREMLEYIDQSAEDAGVSRAEFVRRMLDGYRAAEEAGECPECGTPLEIDS